MSPVDAIAFWKAATDPDLTEFEVLVRRDERAHLAHLIGPFSEEDTASLLRVLRDAGDPRATRNVQRALHALSSVLGATYERKSA